jgi:hypothetical protein
MISPFQNCEFASSQLDALQKSGDQKLDSPCDVLPDCHDVTDYGAAKDGQSDALTAIQRAADAVGDGGTLYFPAGKYLINESGEIGPMRGGIQISQKRNVKILGDGADKSIIIDGFNSRLYPDLDLWVGTLALRGGRNISVSDLGLISRAGFAADSPSYGGMSNGLLAEGVIGLRIENISSQNYNSSGIMISSRREYVSKRCESEQPDPSQNVTIVSNVLAHNRVAGVMLDRTEHVVVENNHVYGNGSPGDGHTGYGTAASSCGAPRDVTVRNNLVEYNVRKGIDFHSGFDLKVHDNLVIGNGLYGIFFSGEKNLGGSIEVYNNSISKMNPTLAQSIHQLDTVKYPKDLRNDPTGGQVNDIYNSVFGIYFYMRGDPPDPSQAGAILPAQVKVYNNEIFDFGGENPPNGVSQSYIAMVLRARYRSYAVFEVKDNEFDLGDIESFMTANRVTEQQGRRILTLKNNLIKYKNLTSDRLIYLSQMRQVNVLDNTFLRQNPTSPNNSWTDAAIVIDPYSKAPYLTDPVITSSGNIWKK